MALSEYLPTYQAAAQQYGIDPNLLIAQGQTESNFDPDAIGPDTKYGNAEGIAQIIPDTAKRLGITDPKDPQQAIPGQAKLMAENIARYGNIEDAVRAYHGGTNKANWGPKTEDYVNKVMSRYKPTTKDDGSSTVADAVDPDEKFFNGSYTPVGTTVSTVVPLSNSNEDPDEKFFTGAYKSNSGTSSTRDDSDKSSNDEPNTGDKLGMGLEHGTLSAPRTVGQHIGDTVSQGLADVSLADQANVDRAIAQSHSKNAAQEAAYQKRFGNSNIAAIPDIIGQVISSAPYLATGGAGLEAVGGKLASALPGAAEALESAAGANKLTRFVSPLATRTAAGAAQGAGFGAVTGQDVDRNAVAGGIFGAGAGLANKLLKEGSNIAPEVAQLAKNAMDKYGIEIPGGLLSGNPLINRTYSGLERFGLTPNNDNAEKFATAISQQMGGNTSKLTRSSMGDIEDNIGKMYDQVHAATPKIKLSDNVLNKLGKIEDESSLLLPSTDNRIKGQISKLLDIASKNNGEIPSESWHAMVASGSPLTKLSRLSTDPASDSAYKIKDALYQALGESAPPEVKPIFDQANKFWKNYKTIQPLADPVTGEVSPTRIANAVNKTTKKFGDKGLEGLQELGDIGKQFALTPSSGTTENQIVAQAGGNFLKNALGGAGAVSGAAGIGHAIGGPVGALIAPVLGLGAGRIAGGALASDAYRNALIKRGLGHLTEEPDSRLMKLLQPTALAAGNNLFTNDKSR